MGFFRRLFGQKSDRVEAVTSTDEQAQAATPPQAIGPVHTRRLDPPKSFVTSNRRIRFGVNSNIGGRTNNEDAAMAFLINAELTGNPPPIGMFMVADGMGGHQDGEQASSIVARMMAQCVLTDIVTPQLENREINADQKTIPEVLTEGMSVANNAVQQQVPGGGTTATCIVIRGDLAYITHVGDSRAYLVSEGNLELVTRDHLLVRRLQELGQLTSEEADSHPQRNVLYRAVGQSEQLEVDATTRRLPPSARMLLCSDGLWGVIGDDGIMDVLQTYSDPQEACDQLIKAANASGGTDNITAIIIQMPD